MKNAFIECSTYLIITLVVVDAKWIIIAIHIDSVNEMIYFILLSRQTITD